VLWRSCLSYRHVGCLRLSRRRPPEMCGLRTRPRTDVDPPRFLDLTAVGGIFSRRPRAIPCYLCCCSCCFVVFFIFCNKKTVDCINYVIWSMHFLTRLIYPLNWKTKNNRLHSQTRTWTRSSMLDCLCIFGYFSCHTIARSCQRRVVDCGL